MDSSGSKDKKSAPKFSSFKPPPASSDADRASARSRRYDHNSGESRRRRHDHRSRSPQRTLERDQRRSPRRHSSYQHRHRRHSRSPGASPHNEANRERTRRDDNGLGQKSIVTPTAKSVSFGGPDSNTDKLYIVDRKGDRSVLNYGTVHPHDIPSYRRTGSGQVLGLPGNLVIDRDHPDPNTLVLRDKNSELGMGTISNPLSGSIKQPSQLYRLKQDVDLALPEDWIKDFDYLALSTEQPNAEHDSGDEYHAYRSILGKAKTEDDLPKDMEKITGHDGQLAGDLQIAFEADRRSLNAKLLNAVDSNPKDGAAWLRLIDHQNLVILLPGEETRPLSAAERKSVAEVKLSIYDKALKVSGETPFKDVLLLGRLHEGSLLWDRKKFWGEWHKTLKRNPNSLSLHLKYLDLRQTDLQTFSLDECKSLFIDCMKRIDAIPDASRHTRVQCYLLLRLTLLLREAGYTELAVGLWQAVLEFACFPPAGALDGRRDTALQHFSKFWDCEVARLGERDESGWHTGSCSFDDPVSHEFSPEFDFSWNFFSSWEHTERSVMQSQKMPGRSVDEYGANADPAYSVVLPSDLRDILQPFWNATIPENIIDAFLYFCLLPHLTVPDNAQTTRPWSGDNFVENAFGDTMKNDLSDWLSAKTDESESTNLLFSFPIVNFLHTPETLFAPKNWFYSLQSWSTAILSKSHPLDTNWLRRTLRVLVARFTARSELAEYALAVEFASDPGEAIKFGKYLLASGRSSPRIANAVALMQCRSGAQTSAFEVWEKAINERKALGDKERLNSVILWNTWAWELLQQGDFSKPSYLIHAMPLGEIDMAALNALNQAAEVEQSMVFQKLRFKKFIEESYQRALDDKLPHVYAAYVDCFALTQYLSGKSLDDAMDIYLNAILRLVGKKEGFEAFTAELLHQARARLIYFHISRGEHFDPRRLKIILRKGLALAPHNTMFLSLYMWNDARLPILDRIREPFSFMTADPESHYAQVLADHARSPIILQWPPVSTHLFLIHRGLSCSTAVGTHYSIREVFERALGERSSEMEFPNCFGYESARSNVTIWKLYILFELEKASDLNRAKAIFYRAIRACPWSKDLILIAFERLYERTPGARDGLQAQELRQLYHLLIEKQMRVHVDLAKGLEEMDARKAKADLDAEGFLAALEAALNGAKAAPFQEVNSES